MDRRSEEIRRRRSSVHAGGEQVRFKPVETGFSGLRGAFCRSRENVLPLN